MVALHEHMRMHISARTLVLLLHGEPHTRAQLLGSDSFAFPA